MKYYLYILECADRSYYTGITTDLERRLKEHNESPKKGAKYTRTKKPCRIVYTEEYPNRSLATKREQEIKRMNSARKESIIRRQRVRIGIYKHAKTGNLYKVHALAKHSETLEDLVVYECLYENAKSTFWVRPYTMFFETVTIDGEKKPRFEYLKKGKSI